MGTKEIKDTINEKGLKLFNGEQPAQEFIKDLSTFITLLPQHQNALLSIYPLIEDIDTDIKGIAQEIAKKINIDANIFQNAVEVSTFLILKYIQGMNTLEDIENDLKKLNKNDIDINNVIKYIKLFNDEKNKNIINNLIKSTLSMNSPFIKISAITVSYDYRILYDDNDNIKKTFPIALVNLKLKGEKRENIKIQFTLGSVKSLIIKLKEIEDQLERLYKKSIEKDKT